MIDLYLRAADEAAMAEALPFARSVAPDGASCWVTQGNGWSLDLIGAAVLKNPVLDVDGNIIAAAELDERFHANLRVADLTAAEDHRGQPYCLGASIVETGEVLFGDPPNNPSRRFS